ncbi:hypothetical protein GCM10028798_06570 [Humibacter antri]
MCASYGLDPRFTDPDGILEGDAELLSELRTWAADNADETLLPTGKNLRNLNPIIQASGGRRVLQPGWWGYLVRGEPARFPSINTRSERLAERTGPLPERVIVPATSWFEMQKPGRQWFQFGQEALALFAMAAIAQPGRTSDGATFTCFSIVMRPAPDALASVHDRSPLLVPAAFVDQWLTGSGTPAELIDASIAESETALAAIDVMPIAKRP